MPTGDERIFISYRRDEAEVAGSAGRLYDRLAEVVGTENVFMDVDSLRPGQNFREAITQALSSSTLVIALMGPKWERLSDDQGASRLMRTDDVVRIELETALERGVIVVPVLVERTEMPQPGDLPESLQVLRDRQAALLRHRTFRADASVLLSLLADARVSPAEAKGDGATISVALVSKGLLAHRFAVTMYGNMHSLEWRERAATRDEVLFDGVVVAKDAPSEMFFRRRSYRFTPPVPKAPPFSVTIRKRSSMGLRGLQIATEDQILYSDGKL